MKSPDSMLLADLKKTIGVLDWLRKEAVTNQDHESDIILARCLKLVISVSLTHPEVIRADASTQQTCTATEPERGQVSFPNGRPADFGNSGGGPD